MVHTYGGKARKFGVISLTLLNWAFDSSANVFPEYLTPARGEYRWKRKYNFHFRESSFHNSHVAFPLTFKRRVKICLSLPCDWGCVPEPVGLLAKWPLTCSIFFLYFCGCFAPSCSFPTSILLVSIWSGSKKKKVTWVIKGVSSA